MSLKSFWTLEAFAGAIANYGDKKISWGFTSHRIILNYRAGGATVYFSFDGVEDHGEIGSAAGMIRTLEFSEFRTQKIFLRGGDAATEIEVYATPRTER